MAKPRYYTATLAYDKTTERTHRYVSDDAEAAVTSIYISRDEIARLEKETGVIAGKLHITIEVLE